MRGIWHNTRLIEFCKITAGVWILYVDMETIRDPAGSGSGSIQPLDCINVYHSYYISLFVGALLYSSSTVWCKYWSLLVKKLSQNFTRQCNELTKSSRRGIGFVTTTSLQIYAWVRLWKNFADRSIFFGEVTGKSVVAIFLTHWSDFCGSLYTCCNAQREKGGEKDRRRQLEGLTDMKYCIVGRYLTSRLIMRSTGSTSWTGIDWTTSPNTSSICVQQSAVIIVNDGENNTGAELFIYYRLR